MLIYNYVYKKRKIIRIKSLYEKVKQGKIKLFTGIDDIYQSPKNFDIEIRTDKLSVKKSTAKNLSYWYDTRKN